MNGFLQIAYTNKTNVFHSLIFSYLNELKFYFIKKIYYLLHIKNIKKYINTLIYGSTLTDILNYSTEELINIIGLYEFTSNEKIVKNK